MRILRARDNRTLPWKNGLGVSGIIESQPPEADYDELLWQVGTTSITASCPFSDLPGLDRQFMLLEGEGVELRCRGPHGDPDIVRRIEAPFEPFEFRGEWQTECCLLGGPVKVFNVLTRRSDVTARVSVLAIDGTVRLEREARGKLLAFAAEGSFGIEESSQQLATQDAALIEEPDLRPYTLRSAGPSRSRLVVVRLT